MAPRGSQIGQDLFVIALIGDDEPGSFVDVGCQRPFDINNTALLEDFGWRGIALDILDFSSEWKDRRTPFFQTDATSRDYGELFRRHDLGSPIDYLSVDLERCGDRFAALRKVLESGATFKIVTVEHDVYKGTRYADCERTPQRELLRSLGYELVCADVAGTNSVPFEDWWVHPDHLPRSRFAPFLSRNASYVEIFAAAGFVADERRLALAARRP